MLGLKFHIFHGIMRHFQSTATCKPYAGDSRCVDFIQSPSLTIIHGLLIEKQIQYPISIKVQWNSHCQSLEIAKSQNLEFTTSGLRLFYYYKKLWLS